MIGKHYQNGTRRPKKLRSGQRRIAQLEQIVSQMGTLRIFMCPDVLHGLSMSDSRGRPTVRDRNH